MSSTSSPLLLNLCTVCCSQTCAFVTKLCNLTLAKERWHSVFGCLVEVMTTYHWVYAGWLFREWDLLQPHSYEWSLSVIVCRNVQELVITIYHLHILMVHRFMCYKPVLMSVDSAGIGRTGAFIIIDTLLKQIERFGSSVILTYYC